MGKSKMRKHNHVTRDNKPQEFYIRFLTGDNYSTHQITDVSMNKLTYVPSEHDYHVIEYSVYEKLQQENERLKDLIIGEVHTCSKHCKRPMCVLRMENEQLKKALEVADSALEGLKTDLNNYGVDILQVDYEVAWSDPNNVKNTLLTTQEIRKKFFDRNMTDLKQALEQIAKIKKGECNEKSNPKN